MSEKKQKGFKRLHFFKMYLSDKDWNHRHRYHIDKQRLHLQTFHRAGIVPSYGNTLVVRQRQRPDLSVIVDDGYAVDAEGNEIILRESKILKISREEFYFPCTVNIVARYQESAVEFQRMKSGKRLNRYYLESGAIEAVAREPHENEIFLAQIRVSEDAYKFTDARDVFNPRENEIDLRMRLNSATLNLVDPAWKRDLLNAIRRRRHFFLRLAGNRLLRAAAPLAHTLGAMELVVDADLLTPQHAADLADALRALDDALLEIIKENIDDPWILDRPDFQAYQRNVKLIESLLDGPLHFRIGNLEQVLRLLNKMLENLPRLHELYGNESLIYYPGQEPVLAKEYPLSDDWERIKVWSAEFPEKLWVDGLEWTLMGSLNVTNEASEKHYKFKIENAIDAWRTRQRLYYPDGTMVDDTGVAHEGGFSSFEIRGVTPDTHLAIIRMMDYARADFELEMVVNDQAAGVSQCIGHDRKSRWRNWPFVIPAWFVNDDVIRVKQIMNTAERDVNMFRYWFYQVLDY